MNLFETSLQRYITPEQLALIQAKKVGIGGAGGLGSNIATMLIRTGFKQLEIIDHDTVELSNLNRQDFTMADVGKTKVLALRNRLLTINPAAKITIRHREWALANAQDIFQDSEIVIEAFDKAAVKTAFVEYYAQRIPFIVSGNGMSGIDVNTSATTVRKAGNIYLVGDGTTAIEDGHPPLAPRVIQCAAKMAEVILDLTLANCNQH